MDTILDGRVGLAGMAAMVNKTNLARSVLAR